MTDINKIHIWNPILTFKFGPNIAFLHSKSYFVIQIGSNIAFWHSKSYFEIQSGPEYFISTLEILFRHSNSDRITHFNIRNPILTFAFGPNIAFWHSKSYFNIRMQADNRILTFEVLFWLSNSRRISHFDVWIHFLTFELRPNIAFWQSISFLGLRTWAENRVWHSKSYLTFEFGPYFAFRRSKPYCVIWLGPNVAFFHSKS